MQAEILTLLNDEYGFEYEQETPWDDVFAEAPQSPKQAEAKANALPVQHKSLADFLASADLADSDSSDSSFRCATEKFYRHAVQSACRTTCAPRNGPQRGCVGSHVT